MTFELLKVCRQANPTIILINYNPSCMSVRYSIHVHYPQLNPSRVCLPTNFQKFKCHIFICVCVCVSIYHFLHISLFRFISFPFRWFRFVSFRFRWFRFVSFLFRFALYRYPSNNSGMTRVKIVKNERDPIRFV
jgi:hypothetical protein